MMNKPDTESFDSLEQTGGDEAITRPLGVGAFSSDSAFAASEPGKGSFKLRSSSIVIAIVLVAAVIGLFSMHTLAKVTASVVGDEEMERVIEEFLNSSAGRSVFLLDAPTGDAVAKSNQVLEVLNETYTERQVPLTDVQKDPFILFDPTPATAEAGPTTDTGPSALERQRSERRQQLNTIASRLTLKSVMLGDVPLANINGQIVRPGEIITIMPERQEFEVMSIEAEAVRLSAADLTLGVRIEVDITINRDQNSGPGRPRR